MYCQGAFNGTSCEKFPPGSMQESFFKWEPEKEGIVKCQTYHPLQMSKPGSEHTVWLAILLQILRQVSFITDSFFGPSR